MTLYRKNKKIGPDFHRRKDTLITLLTGLRDKRFLFVRPGGNWGDYLIYMGMEYLARSLGIWFRTIDAEMFLARSNFRETVFYIHGSGGFNLHGSGKAARCLQHAIECAPHAVIQGPCTVGSESAISALFDKSVARSRNEVYFICREQTSFAICKTEFPDDVHVLLNEDTALYLTRDDLIQAFGEHRPRYDLFAIRRDREAIPVTGEDRVFAAVLDPPRYARSFAHWIHVHNCAKTIVTNRTHSAILGTLLGKPTTMFPGSYHKNESVWAFSLKDRGVRWRTSPQDLPDRENGDPFLRWIPSARVHGSYKANELAQRFRGVPTA